MKFKTATQLVTIAALFLARSEAVTLAPAQRPQQLAAASLESAIRSQKAQVLSNLKDFEDNLLMLQRNTGSTTSKEEARKILRKMKQDLVQVSESMTSLQQMGAKDDEIVEEAATGATAGETTVEFKHVSPWLEKIESRFGQVKELEKRLDIMEGLDPLMDGILEKMNEVTDHSKIVEMQLAAKQKKAEGKIKAVLEDAKAQGLEVKAPLSEAQKEDQIHDVVAKTLQKVEEQNKDSPYNGVHAKYAAEYALRNAADSGKLMNDVRKTRPDVQVDHQTVVDHAPQVVGLPPAVSHQAKVTNNHVEGGIEGLTYSPVAVDSQSQHYTPVSGNTVPPAHYVVPHSILAHDAPESQAPAAPAPPAPAPPQAPASQSLSQHQK